MTVTKKTVQEAATAGGLPMTGAQAEAVASMLRMLAENHACVPESRLAGVEPPTLFRPLGLAGGGGGRG